MTRYVLITLLLVLPVAAAPEDPSISFTQLWMYAYMTEDQGSEIPVFDDKTNTVWVAGGRWSASTAGVHGTHGSRRCAWTPSNQWPRLLHGQVHVTSHFRQR
jgi:hypothetical protein